jgi:hypothetical protein
MNLQMTTTQKVVAAFIGMVFLTIGLGIVAGMLNTHYGRHDQNCSRSAAQSSPLKEQGISSVNQVVCGIPAN